MNLVRRLGVTLKGGLRDDHMIRLLEQLLSNHSCWAWSTPTCAVLVYLSIPKENKET